MFIYIIETAKQIPQAHTHAAAQKHSKSILIVLICKYQKAIFRMFFCVRQPKPRFCETQTKAFCTEREKKWLFSLHIKQFNSFFWDAVRFFRVRSDFSYPEFCSAPLFVCLWCYTCTHSDKGKKRTNENNMFFSHFGADWANDNNKKARIWQLLNTAR